MLHQVENQISTKKNIQGALPMQKLDPHEQAEVAQKQEAQRKETPAEVIK